MHRGSSSGAVRSHVRYLQHKDSHEHDDRLVATFGDPAIIRTWDDREPHYRVIVAPERGDVLNMGDLWEEVYHEVSNASTFGSFRFFGAIHEKRQSTGRINKHIHIIFKDTIGVGASAIKRAFSTAAARAATLQFEERGLIYMPNVLDKLYNLDIKQFAKELKAGDKDIAIR